MSKSSAVEAMIDIETFDTVRTAVTFQVGLVMFDDQDEPVFSHTWNLNVDEQLKLGRTMSASTIAFHLGIPGNALDSLSGITVSLSDFTKQITDVFDKYKPSFVWSKGSFDFNILEDIFLQLSNNARPWMFRQERELRTLMTECKVDKGDVSHTAIEDCIAQVKQLKQCRAVVGEQL